MEIFDKNKHKENGPMGRKRTKVLNFTLLSVCLVLFFFGFMNLVLFVLILFFWIFFNIIYGFYMKRVEDLKFRNFTLEEWDDLKNRNIIHYSYILGDQIGNSIIHLPAHTSSIVNFRLPKKYRNEGFVWFHISKEDMGKEPKLNSFLNAHAFEGNPRDYKVILQLNSVARERVFVEIDTGFILVKDDIYVNGELLEEFEWYNKKIYISYIIKKTLTQTSKIYYYLFINSIAKFEDKTNKRNEYIIK